MSEIRKRAIEGLKVRDRFTVSRTFTERDVNRFAEISGDYNPVHLDDRYARTQGFAGRICHGLLVGSILTEIGGQLGMLGTSMNFDFKGPVYFGDTIDCSLTVMEIGDRGRTRTEVEFKNQDGDVVLKAVVTGIVPGEAERRILETMVAEGDPTNKLGTGYDGES